MHFTLKTAIVASAVLCQIPLLSSSEVYPGAMAAGSDEGLWLPPCRCAVGYSFESPSRESVGIYFTFDEAITPSSKSAIAGMGTNYLTSPLHGESESALASVGLDEQTDAASNRLILGIDDVIASIDLVADKVGNTQLESLYHIEGIDFSAQFTFVGESRPHPAEHIAFAEPDIKRAEDVRRDHSETGDNGSATFDVKEKEGEEEVSAEEHLVIAKAFHSFRDQGSIAYFDKEADFEELSHEEEVILAKAFRSFLFDVELAAFDAEEGLEELSSHEEALLAKAFQSMPEDFPLLAFEKEAAMEELSPEEETLLGKAFDSIRSDFPLIVFDRETEIEELTAAEEKYLANAFQSAVRQEEFMAAIEAESGKKEISYNTLQKPSYLTAKFIREITEELVFRDIPKVEVEPEAFDVNEIPEDEDDSLASSVKLDLRKDEEMIAHLSGLDIADDEFVAFNELDYKSKAPSAPSAQQQEEDPEPDFLKKLELKLRIMEWERSHKTANRANEETAVSASLEQNTLLHIAVDQTKTNQKMKKGNPKSGFAITAHPVTNAEYQEFLNATKKPSPLYWWRGTYREGEGDLPVRGLSYLEAEAYAEWRGMRLPTQGELKFAAETKPDAGFDDPAWTLVEEKGVTGILRKKQRAYQSDPKRCVFCVTPE
ncbi:SUMF1/EgtB/PvdO family nonheme iron enzyme [Estrella lausannensis]|uniref:non-specific serine/threonine protein kinase n=1 Tax=Estrella lausannensis TaxID=483423 RepID=A0A0H5DNZ5_9BACT|nr:SUMF1/EgtB/PvdO family nonheme iron enzyme [Estrella lausannensis]CRX38062.1 hypothetical protein ELAC_0710 [Estrella lausannensis]